jgi:hypothetical protein
MEGLADRACYLITATRPESEHTWLGFYAATIPGPDTVHDTLPPAAFNGRTRHEVKAGDMTLTFPKLRPIAVTVVADDTGKPLSGAAVSSLGESMATGIGSSGMTDDAGKVLLALPPGEYRGICSDPPRDSRYIRTYQRPLIVERGDGPQSYEFRQTAGVEITFEAVEASTGRPLADAVFWRAPEDQPDRLQGFAASTYYTKPAATGPDGRVRAVLPPEPGRRYRFQFVGFPGPNMMSLGMPRDWLKPNGYKSDPAASDPIELAAGKTYTLHFVLRKAEQPVKDPR